MAVAYCSGPIFLEDLRNLPKFGERASLVHSLISAYGLLKYMTVISPNRATKTDLTAFHSEDFIDYLSSVEEGSPDSHHNDYGIGYDCPVFENMFNTLCAGVGATLSAARALTSQDFNKAINWAGGWHHAKRDEASGFCYVNDIVLGILELRRKFEKVLYIDLDLHHGDGVEEAFCHSSKVFCFSVHKHAPGFFPGTGSLSDVGSGKGKFCTLNVPLQDGIRDQPFKKLVLKLLNEVKNVFQPNVILVQYGTDTLVGDPFNCFNLTSKALGECLKEILAWKLPLLVLGGGGYNNANTACCWTYLTSILCGVELNEDIPDHENILEYGPGYELHQSSGNRQDHNTLEYLDRLQETLLNHLKKFKS